MYLRFQAFNFSLLFLVLLFARVFIKEWVISLSHRYFRIISFANNIFSHHWHYLHILYMEYPHDLTFTCILRVQFDKSIQNFTLLFYNYSMKISNMRTSMTKNPLSLDRFYRFGNREQSQRLNLKHKPTEKHFLLGKWATKLSEIN